MKWHDTCSGTGVAARSLTALMFRFNELRAMCRLAWTLATESFLFRMN